MLELRNGLIVTISTKKNTFSWPCLWHTYISPIQTQLQFFLMENKNHLCHCETGIILFPIWTFCFREKSLSFSFYFGLSIEYFLLISIAKWDGHSKTIPLVCLFILFFSYKVLAFCITTAITPLYISIRLREVKYHTFYEIGKEKNWFLTVL